MNLELEASLPETGLVLGGEVKHSVLSCSEDDRPVDSTPVEV